jgi:hypothetical protein
LPTALNKLIINLKKKQNKLIVRIYSLEFNIYIKSACRRAQTLCNPSPRQVLPDLINLHLKLSKLVQKSIVYTSPVMETKEALLAACRLKLDQLEVVIQTAKLQSRCSEDLLTSAKEVLTDLEAVESDESEVQKRRCSKFCSILDDAVNQVEREGSQKSVFEKLFSSVLTPCVSGGFDLRDSKMELQALAAEFRSKEQSSNRGVAAAELPFVPSSAGSHSPLESLDSHNIMSKGTSNEIPTQVNNGMSTPTRFSQPGAVSVENDLFGKAKRLRKASRQETITSMKLVSVKINEDWKTLSGRVWFYVTRLFGADKLVIYNLSSDIEEHADSFKSEGAVTTMHLDSRGILWSGHRSGAVIAWKEDEKKALCAGARACSSSVRIITTDETGMVWVGSEKGDVRRLGLIPRAGSAGFELQMHRYLRHTGAGVPERSASANIGNQEFRFLKETCLVLI